MIYSRSIKAVRAHGDTALSAGDTVGAIIGGEVKLDLGRANKDEDSRHLITREAVQLEFRPRRRASDLASMGMVTIEG